MTVMVTLQESIDEKYGEKESEAEDPMIHISHEVWIPEKLK